MIRPVLNTGLFILLFLFLPIYSQDLSALTSIENILFYHPVDLTELPESTQIHFKYNYDPLLFEKKRTAQDNYNSLINSNNAELSCFRGTSRCRYYLSLYYADLLVAYRDDYQDYSFQNDRKEWDPSIGFLYNHGKISYGVGIGRHLPDNMHVEHLSEITDDPLQYVTHGPWQFSCATKLHIRDSDLYLSLFSGPVYSSLFKVITIDGLSFRTFPVSLIDRNAEIGAVNNRQNFSVKTAIGFSEIENIELQTSANSMPQSIEIMDYYLNNKGWLKTSVFDSLFWKLSGNIAGGWMASYNFNRDKFTFFRADSIILKSISALFGLRLPYRINSGVSGSITSLKCPAGFLKLSAFSAWSVFSPLDFRFSDVKMDYLETTLFLDRGFSWSRFTFTPDISVSYIKTKMELSYAHKEIVVLLPFYVDPKIVTVNNQILLLAPSIAGTFHIGKFDFTASVLQRIPFSIAADNSEGTQSVDTVENTHGNASFTGGTSFSLKATWNMLRGND